MLFHTCGPQCGPQAPAGEVTRGSGHKRPRCYTVDFHCHILVPAIERLVAGRPEKAEEVRQLEITSGSASADHNRRVMLISIWQKS